MFLKSSANWTFYPFSVQLFHFIHFSHIFGGGVNVRKLVVLSILVLLLSVAFASTVAQAAPDGDACWGQATKVFAQMGDMGEHASQQPTPRLGLRNLARALYDAGVIDADSMQALGAFVADALGLSIEACID
jgi:hypothetical protein